MSNYFDPMRDNRIRYDSNTDRICKMMVSGYNGTMYNLEIRNCNPNPRFNLPEFLTYLDILDIRVISSNEGSVAKVQEEKQVKETITTNKKLLLI